MHGHLVALGGRLLVLHLLLFLELVLALKLVLCIKLLLLLLKRCLTLRLEGLVLRGQGCLQ